MKAVRRMIGRCVGISASATLIVAGAVALRHMLETPQPLKSQLPGESLLYIWRRRSIFYKVLGPADAPPLVLLHTPDIGASAREMQYIMEPLAQTYRVYAPDLLGFGLSDRPGIAYSAAMYTEFCQDFLREVVKAPATLLASGLSCNYAVAVASHNPDLCSALALISPLALHGDPEQPLLLREYAETPLCKALLYPMLSTRLAFSLTHRRGQADFAQFYANTHQLGAAHAAMALLAGKLIEDTTREFEALSQPVLLIWGTQALEDQRTIVNLHDTSQLRRAREVELIQEAGLAVHEEQPEGVIAALRRWQAETSLALPTGEETGAPRLTVTVQQIAPEPAPILHTPLEMSQFAQENTLFIERIPIEAAPPQSVPEKSSEHTQEAGDTAQSRAVLAYCVKCKKKTEMLNASAFVMKNGRPAVRGVCAICGTTANRIGSLG